MKTTFMIPRSKFEEMKLVIDEMGADVFGIDIDEVKEYDSCPDLLLVSLDYREVKDVFYLGCYVGRNERTY